ncbi:MAG: BamA/TamA family outer membrane protein, partial [candidate division WOR-3 bacterium]
ATDWRGEIKGTYRISYLLTTPLNFLLQPTFKYELKDSIEEKSFSADIGLSRTFGLKLEIGTFLRYFRVWLSSRYALPQSANLPLSRYNITNSQNIYLRYDSRDNIFTPASGLFCSYSFQFAGNILGGDNDFYKNQVELAIFKQLPLSLIFCSRIMAGLIVPYGRTTQIPYFEAFYIGGNNGLRGYNEKAIGPDVIGQEHYGDAINNINFEIRTHFEKLIDFVIFSDIATVIDRNLIAEIDANDYHFSAGLGLRINTPFGPIRIDYAKRLKEPPTNDWGKIHLALLNVF